jgi:hypothetical protein
MKDPFRVKLAAREMLAARSMLDVRLAPSPSELPPSPNDG